MELSSNKVKYRIANSEFLDDSDDFLYYFYIVCGITEGIYLRGLETNIRCNVEDIHVSTNKKESYINVSLEIHK